MNSATRRKLIAKTQLEKTRLAVGVTEAELNSPLPPNVSYTKHFMCEAQFDEQGEEIFAVFRVTDLLCIGENASDAVPPVHVFDELQDAANFMLIADELVDKVEPDAPVSSKLSEQLKSEVVTQ